MKQTTSLDNKQSLAPYSEAASLYITQKMKQHGVTYDELVNRLEAQGINFSSSNMRNKVSRNSLSAGLFFLIIAVLEGNSEDAINLAELMK